jgi:hypothetical protein
MPAYSHLLDEERDQIAVMRAAGRSICAIARALQRAKSTVSRELRRNGLSSGRYSPLHAAGAYQLRSAVKVELETNQPQRGRLVDPPWSLFEVDRIAIGSRACVLSRPCGKEPQTAPAEPSNCACAQLVRFAIVRQFPNLRDHVLTAIFAILLCRSRISSSVHFL